MLLEASIGDAYGVKFEQADHRFRERNNDLHYNVSIRNLRQHPEDLNPHLMRPGCYSDDTQMSLAIAEAMWDDEEPWTVESLADRFVEVYHRDPRRGYTTFFLNVLMNSNSGKAMLSRIGRKSVKSGAFMRAAPLGMYSDINEVIWKAELQASVTHDTYVGKGSAVGAALMVHYLYHDLGPKDELGAWLRDQHFGDEILSPHTVEVEGESLACWHPSDNRRVRVHGWDCLHAAIYAVEGADSLVDVLNSVVEYGGDTDTVATVAMAAASWSKEIKQLIPRPLYDELENGKYGRDYLMWLDKQLVEKYPPQETPEEPESEEVAEE